MKVYSYLVKEVIACKDWTEAKTELKVVEQMSSAYDQIMVAVGIDFTDSEGSSYSCYDHEARLEAKSLDESLEEAYIVAELEEENSTAAVKESAMVLIDRAMPIGVHLMEAFPKVIN